MKQIGVKDLEKSIKVGLQADLKELVVESNVSYKDALYAAAKSSLEFRSSVLLIHNQEKNVVKLKDARYIASFHEVSKKIEKLKDLIEFHEQATKNLFSRLEEEQKFLQKFYLVKFKRK